MGLGGILAYISGGIPEVVGLAIVLFLTGAYAAHTLSSKIAV